MCPLSPSLSLSLSVRVFVWVGGWVWVGEWVGAPHSSATVGSGLNIQTQTPGVRTSPTISAFVNLGHCEQVSILVLGCFFSVSEETGEGEYSDVSRRKWVEHVRVEWGNAWDCHHFVVLQEWTHTHPHTQHILSLTLSKVHEDDLRPVEDQASLACGAAVLSQ